MSNITSPNYRLSFFYILVLMISFIFSSLTTSTVQALVPKSKTFKHVNQGDLGYPEMEYGGGIYALNIYAHPFQLIFYGVGRDGFTLGLAMVTTRFQDLDSKFRWVWAANRGNPVHENSTLTFGTDGNLVLAEADGRVVWQTGTANKGVVDLKLLPNGNLVLVDKSGGFVWQSFNHPTDTLLVGQSLVSGGKLVSRSSDDSDEGHYSMVLENRKLGFYYNDNKNAPNNKSLLYDEMSLLEESSGEPIKETRVVKNVTFNHFYQEDTKKPRAHSHLLRLEFFNNAGDWGSTNLAQQKYNSSFSFLRLEPDGTLKVYTLYDVDIFFVPGQYFSPWEETYTYTSMCQLPEKCGSFGLCENNQCVACPTPNGLITTWNETCLPSKLPSCNINKGPSLQISYYKMVGVDHFSSRYEQGEGPMKVGECKKKCSKDCKCVAFFFNKDTSKCLLLTTQLSTLIKVINFDASSHLAFIKYQK
ncbi:Bulb-type lectin domain [Macleaya cordata]|uniref:Bulb-type lectin domain n=1 Tax=Macleaya cordata TaxID=56857 RepID=A0A200QXH0_MACCD|nr:Bulb-type lectin domain [Macleaya cordata]